MIIGLGTDICDNMRVANLYNQYRDAFLERVYAESELEYCLSKKNPIPYLSARFALKEAVVKACGFSRNNPGVSYKEIYLKGSHGKKSICVVGEIKQTCMQLSVTHVWFSISHIKDLSTAMVILENQNA